MGLFGDFGRKRRKPNEQGIGFEYYEDTHDESGEYVGPSFAAQNTSRPGIDEQRSSRTDYGAEKNSRTYEESNYIHGYGEEVEPSGQQEEREKPFHLPDSKQFVSPRNYQNVVVYKPTTPEDVQTLIDFLKRREPAIVNLDELEPQASQRILDFISGAIYALSGSVHRVAGNIFLLSPEGVEITVPYEKK